MFLQIALLFVIPFLSAMTQELQPKAVRGVWLTNVDSRVLNSREEIAEAVSLCAELGINAIFAVVWNKGFTLYPSRTMRELIGAEIDPSLAGRDPLKELIEEARKRHIKVIAWFEFGFASSYKLNGGPLLKQKPTWSARDVEGKLVSKNGFEWMNALHPEVQDFMISLVMEVVRGYDIDGIQGDDRLPAMPSEGGYDSLTIEEYRKEHHGANPPSDHKNPAWLQWRANRLNRFMKRLYDSVKTHNRKLIVASSPSVYPWSLEEYLQDWPTWVREGSVDLVSPQLYRYKIEDYKKVLDEIVQGQIEKKNLHRFFPGLLLKVGSYHPSEDFLLAMIRENRKRGVNGEVFFFFEGLKKYPRLFKEIIYPQQAVFPDFP